MNVMNSFFGTVSARAQFSSMGNRVSEGRTLIRGSRTVINHSRVPSELPFSKTTNSKSLKRWDKTLSTHCLTCHPPLCTGMKMVYFALMRLPPQRQYARKPQEYPKTVRDGGVSDNGGIAPTISGSDAKRAACMIFRTTY